MQLVQGRAVTGLVVAVFSFNRGGYLRNCVASVRRNLPFAEVKIYDDNSTDPDTVAVLEELGLPIFRSQRLHPGRHGGLYDNMNRALDEAETGLILFLQEDMQIVRQVQPVELQQIGTLLSNGGRAFVFPGFMKASTMRRYRRLMQADPEIRAYVGQPNAADRIAYVDAMIADVDKLRTAGWRFAESEKANAAQARLLFADMPFLADPFMFFCPEVPIYRNRAQSLSSRIATQLTGPDMKAFQDLDVDDVARLMGRPMTDWPVAEDWLTPLNPRVQRPFVYKDVKVRWWLNLLNKAEGWGRR